MDSIKSWKLFGTIFVTIVVASLLLDWTCACGAGGGWGGGGGGGGNKKKNKTKKYQDSQSMTQTQIQQMIDSAWGGFKVPANVSEGWMAWLKKHEEYLKQVQHGNGTGDEELDEDGFPWMKGFPPMEIPPWAYQVKNTGLPSLCYLAPEEGKCENQEGKPSKSWAFNPYMEACQEFQYSGCGGNFNNFRDQLACVAACTNPDPGAGGCLLDTGISLKEDYAKHERPEEEFLNLNRRAASKGCHLKQPNI